MKALHIGKQQIIAFDFKFFVITFGNLHRRCWEVSNKEKDKRAAGRGKKRGSVRQGWLPKRGGQSGELKTV